ncbi:MAG: DUF3347 domain-containing protein, partial [Bacteroidales bacterium]|nr:DUF3347 domain-containing protein [Bacteroidales bacterium]
SLVYVKADTDQGVSFINREVTLGPALGDSYIIEEGLHEGEEIAISGTFSIDAAAQLAGKPSMMNPEGGLVMTGHNHGGSRAESDGGDHEESGTMEVPERQENTDSEFKVQLTTLYEEYLKMNKAFVTSEGKAVKNRASEVKNALDKVDMGLLKGDAHMAWMDQLKILEETIDVIAGSSDIETQRAAYVKFNPAFYSSIKAFGLNNTTTYYQYCPMANDDKGAYWLSDTDEILNPYFGDMMLKCGETKEKIR